MHILNTTMLLYHTKPTSHHYAFFLQLVYLATLMHGYLLLGFKIQKKAHVTTRAMSNKK